MNESFDSVKRALAQSGEKIAAWTTIDANGLKQVVCASDITHESKQRAIEHENLHILESRGELPPFALLYEKMCANQTEVDQANLFYGNRGIAVTHPISTATLYESRLFLKEFYCIDKTRPQINRICCIESPLVSHFIDCYHVSGSNKQVIIFVYPYAAKSNFNSLTDAASIRMASSRYELCGIQGMNIESEFMNEAHSSYLANQFLIDGL